MPSYNNFTLSIYGETDNVLKEIGKFQINTKPLGFRGIKGLSQLLRLMPYLTGGKPRFHYEVIRLNQQKGSTFRVVLHRKYFKETAILDYSDQISKEHYKREFEDDPITFSGEYAYEIEIQVGVFSERKVIINFKALAQENVTFNLISGLLGGIIGSFLTWLSTR